MDRTRLDIALWYKNPEGTLYAWMKKAYDTVMPWVYREMKQHRHVPCSAYIEGKMPEAYVKAALNCGPELPSPDKMKEGLRPYQLDEILFLLWDFDYMLYNKRFTDATVESGFLRQHQVTTLPRNWYCDDFTTLSRCFADCWPEHSVNAFLSYPSLSQTWTGLSDTCHSKNLKISFWSPEQCQAARQALSRWVYAEHSEAEQLRMRIREYVQNNIHEGLFDYVALYASPLERLKSLAFRIERTAELSCEALESLQDHEGLIFIEHRNAWPGEKLMLDDLNRVRL